MKQSKQQLQVELKNIPVDASQVHCSISSGLNREETLSVQDKVLACNNPDENLHRQTGGFKIKVFVLSKEGEPLMPCTPAKARHLLRDKKAEVVTVKPFTIRLKFDCENRTQPITLGIDSGYKFVGFSAVSDKTELISGELKLRTNVSKKIQNRKMYRVLKRSKLWYRKPRFLNRVKTKKKGWLAPSIKHKVDTHIRLVDKLKSMLPITKVIVEVAKFDTQKLQDVDIKGKEYQEGQMKGYDNLRAFILYRDKYTCQICKKQKGIMNIHHIIQRSDGGSDKPDNLVCVHKDCHDKFHKGKIKHKFNRPKSFKSTVIMNCIRKYIVDELHCDYTYGYLTKRKRINLGLDKSHVNDAFVIANGNTQERNKPFKVKQVRRNNRCLQKNRKGFKPAIRRQRHKYQPNDKVIFNNKRYIVKTTHCRGTRVMITDDVNKPRSVGIDMLGSQIYGQGIRS